MDNGSPLSGVSVSDALWGSTVATTTSDNDGNFNQASLALGMHSLTYSKSGYLSETLTELLETDGETLNLETVRLLDENCTSGTMSGTITDAVTGDNMSGVNLYYTKGKNKYFTWRTGTYFGQTEDNGSWSLPNSNYPSSISAGWYTILSNKSGYYRGYHDAKNCGDKPYQNNALSPELNEGEMRIMLRWPKTNPVTVIDLDSHLSIPNKDDNGTVHIWYGTNDGSAENDYYVYGANDNVTLDKDHNHTSSASGPAAPPGDETITITKIRSGTYRYSVHNYTARAASTSSPSDNISKSGVKVKVFYNKEGTLVRKRFYVPNDNGTLWSVFTFNSSGSGSGFTRDRDMTYEETNSNIY
jgi:hypothetical protein